MFAKNSKMLDTIARNLSGARNCAMAKVGPMFMPMRKFGTT